MVLSPYSHIELMRYLGDLNENKDDDSMWNWKEILHDNNFYGIPVSTIALK